MILRKLLASASMVISAVMIFTSVAFADSYVVTRDSVNVRQSANTNSSVLGQVNQNDIVESLDSADGWIKIAYGNTHGWISGQFLKTKGGQSSQSSSKGTVYTNTEEVNLRSGPGTDYGIMVCLDKAVSLSLLTTDGNWSKVQTKSGKIGWILSKLISTSSPTKSSPPASKPNTSTPTVSRGGDSSGTRDSDTRRNIVNYAKKFLGVNYVWGGGSPRGFDCSGFICYVFDHYGIDLERVAADQARCNGTKVSKSSLRPGDLVFFDTAGGRGYINHVGIYIGNGDMIHASSGKGEVVISDISDGFYAGAYITGRSFF